MVQLRFVLFMTLSLGLVGCGQGSSSSGTSNPYPVPPQGGQVDGERNLARLFDANRVGKPTKALWAGSWWPFNQGGTSSALAKYEQATRSSGAVAWEQKNHGPGPDVAGWWGHCNGWAAASALFDEPRSSVRVGDVDFGIADRKALLSEIAMEVDADFFGSRYDGPDDPSNLSYQDVFPNQFFLVLTHYVARGWVVLMDRSPGYQVWNYPIAGYRFADIKPSDDLGPHPSLPGVYRLKMSAQVWWVRADVAPDHVTEPFEFQSGPSYSDITYSFELWLDAPPRFNSVGKLVSSGDVVLPRNGAIVMGGEWLGDSLNTHPDYLWVPKRVAPSTGYSNPRLNTDWVTRFMDH